MPMTYTQETCTRNLRHFRVQEKFHASFLHQNVEQCWIWRSNLRKNLRKFLCKKYLAVVSWQTWHFLAQVNLRKFLVQVSCACHRHCRSSRCQVSHLPR